MDRQAVEGDELLSRRGDIAMHETGESEIEARVRPARRFRDDTLERR